MCENILGKQWPHVLFGCQVFRRAAFRGFRNQIVVLLTACRDKGIVDPIVRIDGGHVLFADISRVRCERADVVVNACGIEILNRSGD